MAKEKPLENEDRSEDPPDQRDPGQISELSELDALRGKLAELEDAAGQYKDQILRKAAEFDNYKKRVDNDYASILKYSNEDLILKLLPVLDDFERSFRMSRGSGDPVNSGPGPESETGGRGGEESFRRGMELIYQKFTKILEAQGVRPFEVLGKPFDPHLHDALLQVPRKDVPPHTVIEEVDKGYMLHDKVLRHAKVVVAADSSAGESSRRGAGGAEEDDAN